MSPNLSQSSDESSDQLSSNISDTSNIYDVLIIGGGINGCGIARELAGRGYRVLLAEKGDIGSGTSSWSSKLIHGGLRYLEQYAFGLVREALNEREVLLNMAPHLIEPARFILPHTDAMRPKWLLRLGLFVYDHLGGRKILPASRSVDLTKHPAGRALKGSVIAGFEYSDCKVDDTRLTLLNAVSAGELGAEILTQTKVETLIEDNGRWRVTLSDPSDIKATDATNKREVSARLVINAAGPWVDMVLRDTGIAPNISNIRLVKGSHVIVPALFDHNFPYLFQAQDGRVVFAIPYQQDFTLLGTTDVDFEGDPQDAKISPDETRYILDVVNQIFDHEVTERDVVSSYSGVRPLFDDGTSDAQNVTREYVLKFANTSVPLLNIFGGKLTTYRQLAGKVVDMVAAILPPQHEFDSRSALPGGEMGARGFADWQKQFMASRPDLPNGLLMRASHAYGARAERFLPMGCKLSELGPHFGSDLYAVEIDYLVQSEWAKSAEDVLWRRSKLGLQASAIDAQALDQYIGSISP
jgi:glycerol-3-phosphate dehydrogenase